MHKSVDYFFGEVEYSVEERRRVSFPVLYTKILEKIDKEYKELGVYISEICNSHLRCFPQSYKEKQIGKYLKRPLDNKERIAFFASTLYLLDSKNRLLLPGRFGGLEKVLFVGNGDVLDIWDPKGFKR